MTAEKGLKKRELAGPWRVGSLLAYSREERDQLGAVQALMNGHLNLEAPHVRSVSRRSDRQGVAGPMV